MSILDDAEAMAVLRRLKETGYRACDIRAAYDAIRLPAPPPTQADLDEARRRLSERLDMLLETPFQKLPERIRTWKARWIRSMIRHEERQIRKLRAALQGT